MTALPRAAPSAHGVDPRAVLGLLDALEAHPEIELHSLMVVRHGHVVVEGCWAPYRRTHRQLLYSLSKTFAISAVGLAAQEGILDLDDPVLRYFPDLDGEITDPRTRRMTLRHLACMASGHDREMWDEALTLEPEDPARGLLRIPPDADPGSLFAYSQPCTYTLARILQSRTGMTLSQYLRPRLLDPLGIDEVGWHAWPPGVEVGASGLHARTEDVAKIGLLYLQGGRWEGHQLLPRGWVEEATSYHVGTPMKDEVDWQVGYGYHFWRSRHGYRGDGALGQFCVVLPEQQTVVATTGRTERMQAILDALWEHLLPGLGADVAAGPGGTAAEAPGSMPATALSERLSGLRLPPTPGALRPQEAGADPGAWHEVSFEARGPQSGPLRQVTLAAADGRWQIRCEESDNALTFPLEPDPAASDGDAGWTVSAPSDARGDTIPVACSGGWTDPQTLQVTVLFLETPHRLELTCTLPDRVAHVTWPRPPLHGTSLALQHCP